MRCAPGWQALGVPVDKRRRVANASVWWRVSVCHLRTNERCRVRVSVTQVSLLGSARRMTMSVCVDEGRRNDRRSQTVLLRHGHRPEYDIRLIGTPATGVPCQHLIESTALASPSCSHLSTSPAPSPVTTMAASSGHLSPAEAASPERTPLQRPTSAHSNISRRSAAPTVASSVGNFPLQDGDNYASSPGGLMPSRTTSGRSTPAGYHLRGSRTPSIRDPNAQLDDMSQIPERPNVVPPAPPLVSRASDQEDAAVRQAIKKGSRIFHKRRPKRSDGGESDSETDAEAASRRHHHLRELERVERQTQEAQAQLAKRRDQVIDVYDGDEQITSAVEVPEVQKPQKPVYVWEGEWLLLTSERPILTHPVMYENQRGMSLFGKKWYSANSLLPSDPTAYTLPTELPGVTTISATDRSKQSKRARRRGHARGRSASTGAMSDQRGQQTSGSSRDSDGSEPQAFKRRTNDTGYDLKTYQTPSPDWVWLTPWMVNMRADADEQGFRYNLWFHRRGWRPHAGRLNWWGWVRRREWMRLRVLLPSTDLEREVAGIESGKEWPATLDEVMARPLPVRAMVKLLVVELLDRERLECFFQWWEDGTDEARKALKGELDDYDNVSPASGTLPMLTKPSSTFSPRRSCLGLRVACS